MSQGLVGRPWGGPVPGRAQTGSLLMIYTICCDVMYSCNRLHSADYGTACLRRVALWRVPLQGFDLSARYASSYDLKWHH